MKELEKAIYAFAAATGDDRAAVLVAILVRALDMSFDFCAIEYCAIGDDVTKTLAGHAAAMGELICPVSERVGW